MGRFVAECLVYEDKRNTEMEERREKKKMKPWNSVVCHAPRNLKREEDGAICCALEVGTQMVSCRERKHTESENIF